MTYDSWKTATPPEYEADEGHADLDVQCKRCGSSISIEACDDCGGTGFSHHDCGEDCCSCAAPEDNVPCSLCSGEGTWGICLSSEAYCNTNPRPGCEDVPRHTVEEFKI